jgi:phosphoglycolate phosphatase
MKKIIFDFDGTLIDSRLRLFNLFSFLVPNSKMSFEEYWLLKAKGTGHKEILKNKFNFEDNDVLDFQKKWMILIEDKKFLKTDEPFILSTKTLNLLKNKGFDLVLLTARQSPENVKRQLIKFNWTDIFFDILVTEQIYSKRDLITQSNYRNEIVMMIGDTGYDIKTANDLNIFSVAVLSGFHSEETLKSYSPKLIIQSVDEIINHF